MSVIESQVDGGSISTILDLGCGTGRFSEGLATRFRARVVGVDPSQKMLDQARRKLQGNGIHYQRGTGEAIPLVDGAVDMIFHIGRRTQTSFLPAAIQCSRDWLRTTWSAASKLFANTETGRVGSLLSSQSMCSSFDSEVTRSV